MVEILTFICTAKNFHLEKVLSSVNDYIEDMVTFTTLVKIYSTEIFLRYKGSWAW